MKLENEIYCTLSDNAVPTEGCSNYRNTKIDTKNDQVIVWAFNKNINNNLDPLAGWFKMSIGDIDNYEFIGDVKYGE